MTSPLWSLVEFAARPLDRDERDAVLGDSLEAGERPRPGALLHTRPCPAPADAALEKLAAVARCHSVSACPAPALLMTYPSPLHAPLTGSWACSIGHWAPTGNEGFALLACHIFLLIAWSWTERLHPRLALAANSLAERRPVLLLAQYFITCTSSPHRLKRCMVQPRALPI